MTATKARSAAREEALQELGTAFKGIMAAVRRLRGRETHHSDGLSFAQYHLLFGLSAECELTTGQLAAAADLSPASVTPMLDALVGMELVERTRSESDRRVVTCALTDRGRELVTAKRTQWEKRWRETLSEFSSEELEAAAAVLGRLRTMYDKLD